MAYAVLTAEACAETPAARACSLVLTAAPTQAMAAELLVVALTSPDMANAGMAAASMATVAVA